MRIAVTGARGFIGRALCRALHAAGHEVIACVRSGQAADDGAAIDASEIRKLSDITDRDALAAAMAGASAVAHLAGRAHVTRETAGDPLAVYRTVNVEGTKAVADAAARAGVRRLVFLSSVKVNGERTTDRPFSESDPPRPEDPYGISKQEAESALFEKARQSGLEAVCLRPPLVYGPGVRANFVSLLKLCDSPLPLPFGSLTANRRSFISIDNLVSAVASALSHPAAAGHTFLVRDGEDLSTAALIMHLRRALDRPARLFSVPPAVLGLLLRSLGRGGMADRLVGSLAIDDSAIRNTLGWTPPVNVDAALEKTVAWFRGRAAADSIKSP